MLEQPDILERQSQQVADIQQVRDFVCLKLLVSRRTNGDNPERPVFSRQRHGDAISDAALRHPLAHARIRFIFHTKEFALFVQHSLRPRRLR